MTFDFHFKRTGDILEFYCVKFLYNRLLASKAASEQIYGTWFISKTCIHNVTQLP